MSIFALILLCLFSKPGVVQAQAFVPIELQLKAAYRPLSFQEFQSLPVFAEASLPIPAPTKIFSTGQVLGASTTSPQPELPPSQATPTSKTITVALLGDSMIDTLGPDFPRLKDSLLRYYPKDFNFNIVNYGKGSDTIEGGLKRLVEDYEYKSATFPSLISLAPDIIVVESFAYNNFGNTQEGFDRHWLNLGAIVSTIKAKLPNTKIVLHTTIAPNAIVFANGIPGMNFSAVEKLEKTQTIKYYLERTITYAQSQGIILADAYTPSLVGPNGDKLYIDKVDNLHPSTDGKDLIANIIAKTIYDNRLISAY